MEQRTERSLLTLLGVFQAALGAPRRREVVLWQRVDFPERLPALFTRELPAHVKGPGTWMHDALEVRDDWESRLLRSTLVALMVATGPAMTAPVAPGTLIVLAVDDRHQHRRAGCEKNTAVHGRDGAGRWAGARTEHR